MKQKRAQLASLGEWKHINCFRPGTLDRVEDDMLTHLIYSPASKDKSAVNSQSALLEAGDDTMEDAFSLSRDKVPGGSVSFLFERSTKAVANDEGQEEE